MPTKRFSRVLAVEDNPTDLRLLVDILEEDGFSVTGCSTASTALDQVRRESYGVAVVDLNLPDLDGNMLLGQILEIDHDVRVIIYTGMASFDSVKEALNRGAFAYIEKLSDPGELLRQVHRACTARVGRYAADLETAVVRRTEELERSNQELQSFASVVAHDLRSPLLTISGYCEILREECVNKLDGEACDYLTQIQAATERMSQLIEDLLDYSRVGRAQAPHATVDLQIVLGQVLENLGGSIRAGRATVEAGTLPSVSGNTTQLSQLFQNLIANAVKFHGKADPVVQIRAEHKGDCWEFAVADNGIGIDRNDFDRIFQVFQRLHGKEYPGTGIGLALCKKIVERHGGRIWLESEPDQGTTFRFTLPALKGEPH